MDVSTINIIIQSTVALGVALLGYNQYLAKLTGDQRREEEDTRRKEQEQREVCRHEGMLIQMEMSEAVMDLSQITARVVRQERTNGEVEEANRKVDDVRRRYLDYMRRMTQMMQDSLC